MDNKCVEAAPMGSDNVHCTEPTGFYLNRDGTCEKDLEFEVIDSFGNCVAKKKGVYHQETNECIFS